MFPEAVPERSTLKIATINIVMVATAFVWYLLAFNGLKELLIDQNASQSTVLLIIGINTTAIILAGLIGSIILTKIANRKRFLYYWIATGIVLSIIPLGLNTHDMTSLSIISLIFGVYFGLGMPTTMGYHSGFLKIEERAKIGGLTFLIIGTSFAITSLVHLDPSFTLYITLAMLRLFSLAVFHLFRTKPPPPKTVKIRYLDIITNRSFLLYFVPWIMFSLINFMTMPIQGKIYPPDGSFAVLTALENFVIAIVAVISGFIADKMGRKRLVIIGFIMIGIGYATIGLFSSNLTFSSIVFTITDGTAWGIFYVIFLFTIWGDLGQMGNSDKYYLLGAAPYVSSYFMRSLFTPYLQNIDVQLIFSFASIFLFLAILPLIYAPETLPEKVLKDRDLKTYVENAKKKAEKDAEKNRRKYKESEPETEEEKNDSAGDKNYQEAQKLAEKYY